MDGPPEEAFDSLTEGGLEVADGLELGRRNIRVGEHPGRIITAAKPDGSFIKVKFVLAGLRVYQVMAYFPSGGRSAVETQSTEAMADKFLESFELSLKPDSTSK